MKNLFILFTLFSSALALPTHSPNRATYFHDDANCFNACDPCFLWQEALNWRFAYYGDFIFNRYMQRRQNTHGAGDIQTFSFVTNGGTVTLNAADWFEFFALLGATKFYIQTPSRINGQQSELFFSPRLSWSIGMRGTVWRAGALAFGFAGQYFRTAPKLNAFMSNGGGLLTYFNNQPKLAYAEWSASFGGSYEIEGPGDTKFVPHLAAVASGAKMSMRGIRFQNDGSSYHLLNLEDKRMWGYAFGLNWLLRTQLALGAEARFGDQKALHLSGELAF